MKHAYRNIYLPNFRLDSGSNNEDAIVICAKHHWAYKRNKNIKTHNNRCTLNGKLHEKKDHVTYVQAPENLSQSGELYPEAIVYLVLVKDHPMFLLSSRNVIESPMDNISTDADGKSPSDPEDTTCSNHVMSKGLFKSRNAQRHEECRRKRKYASNEVIDLTKEKQIKVAEKHAVAARTHAEGIKCQSQIAAIEQALKMGISNEVLRPFMMKTLKALFDNKDDEGEDSDDDVEIVKTITNPMVETVQFKAECVFKNDAICGKCCAEEECVNSEGDLEDDMICYLCKKEAHAFCVTTIDNNKAFNAYGQEIDVCFKCVMNTPSVLQMLHD